MNERAVTGGDRRFLVEVYADARREEIAGWGWAPAQFAAFIEMQYHCQQQSYDARYPRAQHRVLLCDGEDAGQWRVNYADDELVLIDIGLLERFRGRGIGTARITELCREASRRGVRVRLDVRPTNRAYRLYRRLGFEEVERDNANVRLAWRATRGASREGRAIQGEFALE